MTNQHVVSSVGEDYVVVTSDGKEYPVEEISRDDVNDLAILTIDTDDLKALSLGDSDNLQVGQFVVAIGTPLGDYPGSVTTGVISGMGRSVTASSSFFGGSSRRYENVIQTDAAVNPGNSGGPLLDSEGNVIGINFATTSGADNISFAIPINSVKDKIAEYKEFGKFIKPYLGVEYQLISSTEALFYSDIRPGALVTSVVDGSPAQEAGVKRADIITEINGESVTSSFSAMIQEYEVGNTIELTIWRSGETMTLEATLVAAD
jgi:S1-C subfamily serine protease